MAVHSEVPISGSQRTAKSSISLTDEQHTFACELVSAVVAQGLELLKAHAEAESMETEALKILLEERRRGAFVSSKDMGKRHTETVKHKRRDAGLRG